MPLDEIERVVLCCENLQLFSVAFLPFYSYENKTLNPPAPTTDSDAPSHVPDPRVSVVPHLPSRHDAHAMVALA